MPLSAWSPMSAVPPSPAKPTIVTSFRPSWSAAALRPEMDAPVASKAQSSIGMSRAVVGNGVPITVQQHAGTVMIVSFPRPLSAYLMTRVAPHPGHALCPERMSSSAGIDRRAISPTSLAALELDPRRLGTVPREEVEERLADRRDRDVPAAEPRDEIPEHRTLGQAVERARDLRERGARAPEGEGAVKHADSVDAGGELPELLGGERAE